MRQRRMVGVFLALVAALSVVSLSTVELLRRRNLYSYDVGQDYRFAFSGRQVTTLAVDISPEGFVFPQTSTPWDTALVRLHVTGTLASHWFEPSITIDAGTSREQQFFERGAEGDRYLVLTPDGVRPGAPVRFSGSRLRWPSQTGELLLFRNPSPATGRVLVLAPHPDDAEIAAFGLYAASDSFVASITPGNYVDVADDAYAHIYPEEEAKDELKARVRTWDSLVVPSWGGVPAERIVNLGYLVKPHSFTAFEGSVESLYRDRRVAAPDRETADPRFGRYRQGATETLLQGRAATPTWASLVADLRTLLRTVRPAIVVAPHPILDISGDHWLTTTALLEALESGVGAGAMLFLYTNHHIYSEYYPYGPADSVVTLPPWFDGSLPMTSVYSYRLDPTRQVDKLFALDAMHHLHPAPRRLLGGPADRLRLRLRQSIAGLVRDPVSDNSYYRRAVRPNELFFVYAPEHRRALASYQARRQSDAISPSVQPGPPVQVSTGAHVR